MMSISFQMEVNVSDLQNLQASSGASHGGGKLEFALIFFQLKSVGSNKLGDRRMQFRVKLELSSAKRFSSKMELTPKPIICLTQHSPSLLARGVPHQGHSFLLLHLETIITRDGAKTVYLRPLLLPPSV